MVYKSTGRPRGRPKGTKNPNAGRKPTPVINLPSNKGELPSKEIDFNQVLYFAEIQCTRDEAAGAFRIDPKDKKGVRRPEKEDRATEDKDERGAEEGRHCRAVQRFRPEPSGDWVSGVRSF